MSKFFNRNWKAGFTLVELIVVIAILAILAGIAIPVYSGYIKKANKAADLQLLDAANTAFGAACLENNINPRALTGASLVVKDKKITGIAGVSGIDGAVMINAKPSSFGPVTLGAHPVQMAAPSTADLNSSFLRYFKGNETVPLKYYTQAGDFTFRNGAFCAKDDAKNTMTLLSTVHDDEKNTTTFTFKNAAGEEVKYTVSDAYRDAFLASSLGTNMKASDLTSEVSGMVNAMASMMSSGGTQLAGILADAGLDYSTLGMDVYQKDADGNFILDAKGNKILDNEKLGNYSGDAYANAVVMMVAQNTDAASFTALQSAIASKNIGSLVDMSDKGGTLSNVAMLYGIAEAYSHSDAASTQMIGDRTAAQYMDYINEQIKTAAQNKDITGVLNAIQLIGNFAYDNSSENGLTTQFASYMTATGGGKSQLETDAAGYIAAMQTVNGNAGALADSGAMSTGFDDPTIAAILNAILGGN